MSLAQVRQLSIHTTQGECGVLRRGSQYEFLYHEGVGPDSAVSLTMPVQKVRFASNTVASAFWMNRPEGWLAQQMASRLNAAPSDLDWLAAYGQRQIGRWWVEVPSTGVPSTFSRPAAPQSSASALQSSPPPFRLSDLLDAPDSEPFLQARTARYWPCGVAGVQPKVLATVLDDGSRGPGALYSSPASASPAVLREVLIKWADPGSSTLVQNEFLCLEVARRAGLEVPPVWLSQDRQLLVVQRFDRVLAQDEWLGFEDMAVLLQRRPDPRGHYKYQGSYEEIAKAIRAWCGDGDGFRDGVGVGVGAVSSLRTFFASVALSVLVRNGDAHLKNFGLLYEASAMADRSLPPADRSLSPAEKNLSPSGRNVCQAHQRSSSVRLAPVFDVVCTRIYESEDPITGARLFNNQLALKLAGERRYPRRETLLQFGREVCGERQPEQVLERIATAMHQTLEAYQGRVDPWLHEALSRCWAESLGLMELHQPGPQKLEAKV